MTTTIFKNFWETVDPHPVDIFYVLDRIRDGKSKALVEKIRTTADTGGDYEADKKRLPLVLFSAAAVEPRKTKDKKTGKTVDSCRLDESVTEHSGLFALDFDKCASVEQKIEQLRKDPYIFAVWRGPTGRGVKALVRCPASIEYHAEYYTAFLERYPDLDSTSRNISRGQFESYDPDLWVNEGSLVWDKRLTREKLEEKKTVQKNRRTTRVLRTAVDMIRTSYDGKKHETLLKAANLLGGYIATGRVDESEAIKVLEDEIKLKGPKDFGQAQQTIREGIEYGKTRPLQDAKRIEKEQEYLIGDKGEYSFLADEDEMMNYEVAVRDGTLEMGLPTGINELNEFWMFKKHHLVWMAGIDNVGKAQPLNAPIMTPSGWKKMGDIKAGDFVTGSDGKPKEVIGVYPQGKQEVWEVEFDDGSIVECSGDHLWEVRFNSLTTSVKTTRELQKDYKIGNKFMYRVKLTKPIEFPKTNTVIPPYVLGVLLGDGSLTNGVRYTNCEEDISTKVRKLLPAELRLKRGTLDRGIIKTHGLRNQWRDWLREKGLNVKSGDKYIPEEYLKGNTKQRLELLRGLIDTDGHCCEGGYFEYCTKSVVMADQVVDLCKGLGLRVSKVDKIVNGITYKRVHIKDYGIKIFSSKKHTRKYKKPKRSPNKKIISIKNTGVLKQQQCLGIASSDNLYITSGYTLTHNSFSVWYFAVLAATLHDWKFLVYSAENGDGQLRKKLKEFYLGKSIKVMDDDELLRSHEFVKTHFKIISSKELHTVDEMLLKAELVYDNGWEFDCFIAEPYNSFDPPKGVDSHQNNIHNLNRFRVFKENYTSLWICDHVHSLAARNRDKDGFVKTPYKSEIDGGTIKASKTDDFLMFHRLVNHETRKNEMEINVQKIKDKETGGSLTEKDKPVIIQMNLGYCGYSCNGIDPIKEYWRNVKTTA